MNRALISIDYTYDFVAEDGKLTCGEPGRAIEQDMVKLTREFLDSGDFVVFAIDTHVSGDNYHPESKLFPPHNIKGTSGRKLYGELNDLYKAAEDKENVLWMDKTRYSAFAGTELFLKLRERGINELHFCGVCTDICVLHSVVDAYNFGFKIIVHEKCVASFNADGHKWALEHFKSCIGAEIR